MANPCPACSAALRLAEFVRMHFISIGARLSDVEIEEFAQVMFDYRSEARHSLDCANARVTNG